MSSPNQPNREKEIFGQAIDLPSAEARLGYVQGACGGDAALLARVQTLLRAHDEAGGFLPDHSGVAATVDHAPAERAERPGAVIGRYKLLEKIGEGGFGTVYMAAQEEPVRRRVALKVIKLGMDTKEVVARFEAERQALAMMDHPNIAKVLDGGATETGRPYFVMELVKGVPITTYCDQRQLSTPARLELFMLVCQAVQHAHQKGIIHRDLKPSNILVTEQDDRAVPKVIDFGVARATQARLTEKTMFTQFNQMVGTPAYMSPEQTGLANLDIDTRSDIYSLGVLLYELLTGCTPFDSKKLLEAGYEGIMRMIREVEPPKPSTRLSSLSLQELTELGGRRHEEPRRLGHLVQGDLDWIVMKALEKDRSRRYETATSLAQDLQRHLSNEPIVARPASTAYRLRKLVARNKLAVGASAVVAAALVIGLAVSTWAYFNEKSARQFAVEAALAEKKAFEVNRTIRINAGEIRRQGEASEKKAAVATAKGDYAVAVLKDLIHGAEVAGSAEKIRTRELLDPTVNRLRKDTQIPPEAKQELCDTVGDLFMALGEFGQAEIMYRLTVKLRRELRGDGHPETAAAVNKLSEALKRQGKDAEAAKTLSQAQEQRSDFFRSERWMTALRAEVRDLETQGRFVEADAKLQEASAIAQANLGDRYDPTVDLGLLARLRFEAGDFAAAKKLANQCIVAEKAGRRWGEAGTFGFMIQIPYRSFVPPYDAHTILGLVALREGDKPAALAYLLRSASGVTPWTKFEKRELELATALLAAGERDIVLQFLDRIHAHYVDPLVSRDFLNAVFFGVSLAASFEAAATGREHALELGNWRMEVVAGKIPTDWERLRGTAKVTDAVTKGALPPISRWSLGLPESSAVLFPPLFPYAFLMIGWCAAAVAPRAGTGRRIPAGAAAWLIAYCTVRTLDSALFVGMLFGEGFRPNMLVTLSVSFVSWVLLWEFVRALVPGEASRRETRFMHGLFCVGILTACVMEIVGYSTRNEGFMTAAFLGLLLLLLLTFSLAFAVCYVAGRRLWRWQRNSDLSPGQRLSLKLAVPLLMFHGYASLFVPVGHDGNKTVAAVMLWANALLPWLLAIGFFGRTPIESTAAQLISGPKHRATAHD